MPKFLIILLSLSFISTNLIGQEVSLSGGFLPYEAYYIQSIDLATGKADVQLFDYLIHSTNTDHPYDPPIELHIQFTIEIYSPQLNINEKTALLDIPFGIFLTGRKVVGVFATVNCLEYPALTHVSLDI